MREARAVSEMAYPTMCTENKAKCSQSRVRTRERPTCWGEVGVGWGGLGLIWGVGWVRRSFAHAHTPTTTRTHATPNATHHAGGEEDVAEREHDVLPEAREEVLDEEHLQMHQQWSVCIASVH